MHPGTVNLSIIIVVMNEELGVPEEAAPAQLELLATRMSSPGTCCYTKQAVQRDWLSLIAPGGQDRLRR